MTNDLNPPRGVAGIDPSRLVVLLENSGWRVVGGRRDVYNRIAPPPGINSGIRSVLIPLDRGAPEFIDLMQAALIEISESEFRDTWATISLRLGSEPADTFRFRKENSAPSGLISWKQGEDLIAAARATLVAGAKSRLERARRYSNRLGQFAGRYLDSVLMGQTAIGSYIVTAYAPTNSEIPISGSQPKEATLPGIDSISSRGVTSAVAKALGATSEAIDHYRSSGSLSGFEAGVKQGLSYDLTVALHGVTKDSDGGEIVVEWDPAQPVGSDNSPTIFEFTGSDAAVLESASTRLGVSEEGAIPTTIIGRVHLLTKKHAGGPGVFGLETLTSPSRKYRVRLEDESQYHLATRAHEEDLALRVFGNLERDGMISWLYNANIQGVIGPIDMLLDSPIPEMQVGLPDEDPANQGRFDF
ncbi:hypothetical protein [Amycolatopsis kentuckyensis]|uniref:hypothetical protein n=1 Tax=Amycolatopsis kentuckyensis TaxID=218823 RepID=UPI0035625B26